MRLTVIAVALLLITPVVARQQQSTPPPTTFRGGVQVVRVDMYPSRDGIPITDLRQDEVELREDGVVQTIDSFEHVSIAGSTPEATRVEPNSIRAGQQMASDPRARVFVIFLDSYHMDAQTAQQARTPVRRFLEEALGPDDLVAVMTPEIAGGDLTFTRRTGVVSGLLDKTEEWLLRDRSATSQPLDATERAYEECFPPVGGSAIAATMIRRRREKLSLDAIDGLTTQLGAVREERKTVLVVTLGWTMFEPDQTLAARRPNEGPPPVAPIDGLLRGRGREGAGQTSDTTQMLCERDRLALANLDDRERIRDIIGNANRANVSFYPISPLRNPAFSAAGGLQQLSYLRQMAEDTDGLAIVNTNNIAEPMRRVVADMSSYYLVGYRSTNSRTDGRFRTVAVSVKRPGVQVRARRGYRAPSAAELTAASAVRSETRGPEGPLVKAFGSVASASSSMPFRIRGAVWARDDGGSPKGLLWLAGELDATTRRGSAWSGGATVDVTVRGESTGTIRRTITVPAGSSAFALRVPETGSVAPGQYDVRLNVRPAGAGSAAGDAVSDGLTLTVPGAPSSLGEPLLLRRSPATGVRYVEAADPRFARNERLRLELPTSSTAAIEARIVDRSGQVTQVPAQVTRRPDVSGEFDWAVVDVTLAPFAAGDYAVTVTQETSTHIAGFRVIP